jgi:23S rRNA pseudouridine1911/1915/1917 synthase
MKTLKIEAADAGKRLDVFLASQFSEVSRSKLQKQIKAGAITVNDRSVTPHVALNEEDEIQVPEEALATQTLKLIPRPDLSVEVVFEDDEILVVNKPSGMLVHPATTEEDTLVNFLLAHCPDIAAVGDKPEERPGIVHRLDKDASGLLIVAKTPSAFESLKNQFKDHLILKEYTVLVGGHVSQDEGTIDLYIGRSSYGGKMAARPQPRDGDRNAVTLYRREQSFEKADLLTVRTETGRTHQIRVHLNAVGAPVAGDKLYGLKSRDRIDIDRLFLHCRRLEFKHPKTEKTLNFEADLPAELQAELDKLA